MKELAPRSSLTGLVAVNPIGVPLVHMKPDGRNTHEVHTEQLEVVPKESVFRDRSRDVLFAEGILQVRIPYMGIEEGVSINTDLSYESMRNLDCRRDIALGGLNYLRPGSNCES